MSGPGVPHPLDRIPLSHGRFGPSPAGVRGDLFIGLGEFQQQRRLAAIVSIAKRSAPAAGIKRHRHMELRPSPGLQQRQGVQHRGPCHAARSCLREARRNRGVPTAGPRRDGAGSRCLRRRRKADPCGHACKPWRHAPHTARPARATGPSPGGAPPSRAKTDSPSARSCHPGWENTRARRDRPRRQTLPGNATRPPAGKQRGEACGRASPLAPRFDRCVASCRAPASRQGGVDGGCRGSYGRVRRQDCSGFPCWSWNHPSALRSSSHRPTTACGRV